MDPSGVLNTYFLRLASISNPSITPILEDGVFSTLRASSPGAKPGRAALSRRGLARRSFSPWMGPKRASLAPPLTKPGRLGSCCSFGRPRLPPLRCACVAFGPQATVPAWLNSRCERSAGGATLRRLGFGSWTDFDCVHPALARPATWLTRG